MKRLSQIPVDRIEKKPYILREEGSTLTGEVTRGLVHEGHVVLFDGFDQLCRFNPEEEDISLDGNKLLVRMEGMGSITILDVNFST